MSLIKKPKKEVFVVLSVKLEKGLSDKLKRYADFLECSQAHIVSGAIAHVIKTDKEFERGSSTASEPVAARTKAAVK